ncbi:MAG: M14 family zinc carboxypeptidase [Owenweeksia sp.]|nr:M14 family zinc carboxypeptidase [Owenweeksia sp.]
MHYFLFILLAIGQMANAQVEQDYSQNKTLSYQEAIQAYRDLEQRFDHARLIEAGISDAGRPLHVFVMGNQVTEGRSLQELARGHTVLLINNAIHPGEPCGVDASLAYARDLLQSNLPAKVLVAIIPIYNVGGALKQK